MKNVIYFIPAIMILIAGFIFVRPKNTVVYTSAQLGEKDNLHEWQKIAISKFDGLIENWANPNRPLSSRNSGWKRGEHIKKNFILWWMRDKAHEFDSTRGFKISPKEWNYLNSVVPSDFYITA